MANETPREKLEAAKELGIFLRENEHVIRLLENGEITVSKFIETLGIIRAGNLPALPDTRNDDWLGWGQMVREFGNTCGSRKAPHIETPPGSHYRGRVHMRPLYATMTKEQQLRGFYPRKLGDKAPCPLCGTAMTLAYSETANIVAWFHPWDKCSLDNIGSKVELPL